MRVFARNARLLGFVAQPLFEQPSAFEKLLGGGALFGSAFLGFIERSKRLHRIDNLHRGITFGTSKHGYVRAGWKMQGAASEKLYRAISADDTDHAARDVGP